ncbi:MAG: amidohydrolase [Deltaproteobacteria bacterium]|nr:amidohydrolase [Deltaproteobacteria bacterium]
MPKTKDADLLITGLWLLPTARQQDAIAGGGVAVAGDRIIAIGQARELAASYPNAERIHEKHGLIMPGLVNTHTHAPMSCFRGLADDLPLMTWLQEHIFPAEAMLTPEIVYHSTLLSLAEMIKSGTTSFCDMYLFAREVARATEESGMRAWIGEVLYDFPSPNYGELENGFAYVDEMFAHYQRHPLITITADPHSVYTCSPRLLQRLGALAHDHNCPYVIHLSENAAEVATCQERYCCTPVQHLDKLELLDEQTLAVHCVMVDEQEIETLATRGVKVAHCPESNMKLASGIAPAVQMLKAGITLGLGKDGSASSNDVDMFGEMNTAAKIHKIVHMDPTAMNAETTLHAATLGGAACLQAATEIGTLAVGKKADIIVLDLNQPHLTPLYNIPSHLVYAARGADVIHSVINGRLIMRNRKLLTLDEEAILARMREIGRHILSTNNR